MKNNEKNTITVLSLIKIIIGTLIMAIGVDLFLLPCQLSTGGFSGLGTAIYYMFGIPIGTTVMILNIPLFLISYFKVGKNFLVNTLIGTFFLSIFLNIFQLAEPLTTDRFLAFIYGSVIVGIGTAIVLKANGSTGGTDLLAGIAKAINPQIKTGTFIVVVDAIIVGINTLFFKDIEILLYSALAIYVLGKILDIFFEGIDFSKMLFIISPKWEEISERLSKEIDRGATAFDGQGMYKRENKKIIMCVMARPEVRSARKIIKEIDPNAFVIVTNAREVFGEGFKET